MGKESDRHFTSCSEINQSSAKTPMISVPLCKVRVFGKQNTAVFHVITLLVNGRMITEVYPCNISFLCENILSYICIFKLCSSPCCLYKKAICTLIL